MAGRRRLWAAQIVAEPLREFALPPSTRRQLGAVQDGARRREPQHKMSWLV
jgi:hypothetical protein